MRGGLSIKKLLAINHELIVRSYIIFPTLLFAFVVAIPGRVITFAWPFIFVYTVERVIAFVLDGRRNLCSWSGVTTATAFEGGLISLYRPVLAAKMGTERWGYLGDPNQELTGINLRRVNQIAGWSVLAGLGILGALLAKFSLFSVFVFYALILGLEVGYAFGVVRRDY